MYWHYKLRAIRVEREQKEYNVKHKLSIVVRCHEYEETAFRRLKSSKTVEAYAVRRHPKKKSTRL